MRDMKLTFVLLALTLVWVPTDAQELPMPPENRPTVILGASYAASWPISELAGRRIINRGVDGNQSHEMTARLPGCPSRRASSSHFMGIH